jgi:hypothetical protein
MPLTKGDLSVKIDLGKRSSILFRGKSHVGDAGCTGVERRAEHHDRKTLWSIATRSSRPCFWLSETCG